MFVPAAMKPIGLSVFQMKDALKRRGASVAILFNRPIRVLKRQNVALDDRHHAWKSSTSGITFRSKVGNDIQAGYGALENIIGDISFRDKSAIGRGCRSIWNSADYDAKPDLCRSLTPHLDASASKFAARALIDLLLIRGMRGRRIPNPETQNQKCESINFSVQKASSISDH